MLKRKLAALEYSDCENFDLQDENHFKKLIYWLEDQKIRHYEIEDRIGLGNIESLKWTEFYNQYLKDIQCFHNPKNWILVADWCLTFAIRLEYEDNLPFNQSKIQSLNTLSENKNPIDNLNLDSEDLKKKVYHLVDKLKICSNQDILITLEAILISIQNLIQFNNNKKQKSTFDLSEIPLGFDLNNSHLNEICKLLRLLYINDLREMQTRFNQVLVQIQSITANPKTDTTLGKIGR